MHVFPVSNNADYTVNLLFPTINPEILAVINSLKEI